MTLNQCDQLYQLLSHWTVILHTSFTQKFLQLRCHDFEKKMSWLLCLGRLVSKIDNTMHLLTYLVKQANEHRPFRIYGSTTIIVCSLPGKTGKGLLWHSESYSYTNLPKVQDNYLNAANLNEWSSLKFTDNKEARLEFTLHIWLLHSCVQFTRLGDGKIDLITNGIDWENLIFVYSSLPAIGHIDSRWKKKTSRYETNWKWKMRIVVSEERMIKLYL